MASQLTVLSLGSIAAAAIELKTGGQGLQHAVDMVSNLPLPNLLYMGVATTALTLWIEMEALKEVSAPLAALIYTTEPLWGAGLAYAFMGDRWGPQVRFRAICCSGLLPMLCADMEHAPPIWESKYDVTASSM